MGNSEDIYIVGASGLAREIANYILDIADYRFQGFIDKEVLCDTLLIRDKFYPVIAEKDFFNQLDKEVKRVAIIIGIGFPDKRSLIIERYRDKCFFPNIIHPSSQIIDNNIVLGEGNLIGPNCLITTSVLIGNFNFFNVGVIIGHDVIIGNYNVFNTQVSISGNVSIGNCNLFGVHSSIIQGIKVGNKNVIGIGSAVIRKVSDNTTLIGVPAKKLI